MGKAATTKARTTGPTNAPAFALLAAPSLATVDALDVDTLVICLTPQMRPLPGAAGFIDWRLCGALSGLLQRGILTGADREKVLMPGDAIGIPRILVLGFGKDVRKDSDAKLDWLIETVNALDAKRIAVCPPEPGRDWMGMAQQSLEKAFAERIVTLFEPEQ